MSFLEIPKKVLKRLDYNCSRFFWQSDQHKRKYCLARCEILCTPEDQGGLGIQDLEVIGYSSCEQRVEIDNRCRKINIWGKNHSVRLKTSQQTRIFGRALWGWRTLFYKLVHLVWKMVNRLGFGRINGSGICPIQLCTRDYSTMSDIRMPR